MPRRAEAVAMMNALLALTAAVDEIIDAQALLAPASDPSVKDHLDSANAAVTRSLEHIQELLSLIEKSYG
jgi:hypothetical protein